MARLIIVEDNNELAFLIASAAKARGHEAVAVRTGFAAIQALDESRFDAGLVDLLLPDVSGYTVLDRLRELGVPAVAMSGVYKGQQFAREAVEEHGALSLFEKPFDMRAMLETVEGAIGGPLPAVLVEEEEESKEEVLLVELELLDEDEDVSEDEPLGAPPLNAEPVTPTRPLEDVEVTEEIEVASFEEMPEASETAVLEAALTEAPAEAKADETPEAAEDEIALALESLEALEPPIGQEAPPPSPPPAPRPARGPGGAIGLAHELAVRVSHKPPSPPEAPPPPAPEPEPPVATPEPPPPDMVLVPFGERGRVWKKPEEPVPPQALREWGDSGDLAATSVPKLLNAFYESRHSGELKLRQDNVAKVIVVEDGQPVYAASNLASERFGRFCVRRGALSEADLNRVAALSELEGIRTGEAMVRLGVLAPDRRRELLEDQAREIIWSTFGWTRGTYAMAPKKPNRQDLVKLLLFPGELILEGVHRMHTLASLRQKMPAGRRLFPAPDPPYALQDLALAAPQAHLLSQADGSKTVEDLLALTDLLEREALAALAGFELLGLLVERREENKRQRISFGL